MALAPLALLALTPQAPADLPPADTRSLTVTVTDDKGGPVAGLRPDEVVVLENGVARDVSRVEPETRPLTAAGGHSRMCASLNHSPSASRIRVGAGRTGVAPNAPFTYPKPYALRKYWS